MDWTNSRKTSAVSANFAALEVGVGKAGSTESVLLVAILWLIAIANAN